VETEDCEVVSRLIGMKIFVNEFVAYTELGKIIRFREKILANGSFDHFYANPTELAQPMIWNVYLSETINWTIKL
jgi:hypothetical protein